MIATDFCNALQCLNPSEHKITAVVSKSLEKAKKLADEFKIPNVYTSYEEFAKDPNIDLVYLSTANIFHHPLSILMLNNGKPVLCEKTCACNTKQTEEMTELAKSKKLFFMEALWSNFSPAYKALREIIDSGTIGQIRHMDAAFFFSSFSFDFVSQHSLGGGGLLCCSVYLIWLSRFIFREEPETITAVGTIADTGVDQSANIILTYKDGARASLSYNLDIEGRRDAYIYGTKGKIYIPGPFWSPTKIEVNGEEREFPLPKSDAKYYYPNSAGLAYEAEAVRQCLEKGQLECPAHTHSDTLSIIKVIDEITAVVSKSLEKAKKFAEKFKIPNVYDSYEEFAKDPNIDLVYVSTINCFHHPLSILMLNNGKPVLCEQTCANNTKQTEEMIELAKSKKLFFMEGLWTKFFPAYKALREIIDSGTIGKIRHLDATMFYNLMLSNDAASEAFLDRSALIDIGVNLIWLANFIFKQKPETITATGVVTDIGVDQSANLILTYKDGAKASLSYDGTVTKKSDAYIYGTQGKIYIHSPFWSTTKIEINGEEREFPLPKSDAEYNYPNSAGLAYEAEAVRQCFEKGELECPAHTHSDTLSLIKIIDEARRQLKENHQKKLGGTESQ
ncbi:trans-1,2-dihydrobenzene-1,2-diol dehydrogenase isoform X3 [Octopus vulgaris]|uniref:Trans-1,2-dihydrobenzene-1,2-diol dehydrogenase n=1 Tax=Octopus vulgaris TaxID=6645 RepID=A0AA36BDI4_OCTVU|nr:trans-1,2-dihydrobenzene-1,2-diol dehydrogenase isoform X3 [Octopus vulgaris]